MAATFWVDVFTVSPLCVGNWRSTRQTRHVFNDVIGAELPAAVAWPASARAGSMTAVFLSLGEAVWFETLLARADPVLFEDADTPELEMMFLPDGDISVAPSDDIIRTPEGDVLPWEVEFSYRQVER